MSTSSRDRAHHCLSEENSYQEKELLPNVRSNLDSGSEPTKWNQLALKALSMIDAPKEKKDMIAVSIINALAQYANGEHAKGTRKSKGFDFEWNELAMKAISFLESDVPQEKKDLVTVAIIKALAQYASCRNDGERDTYDGLIAVAIDAASLVLKFTNGDEKLASRTATAIFQTTFASPPKKSLKSTSIDSISSSKVSSSKEKTLKPKRNNTSVASSDFSESKERKGGFYNPYKCSSASLSKSNHSQELYSECESATVLSILKQQEDISNEEKTQELFNEHQSFSSTSQKKEVYVCKSSSILSPSKQQQQNRFINTDSTNELQEIYRPYSQVCPTERNSIHNTKGDQIRSFSEPPFHSKRHTNKIKGDLSIFTSASNYERKMLRDPLSSKKKDLVKNRAPVNRVIDIDEETCFINKFSSRLNAEVTKIINSDSSLKSSKQLQQENIDVYKSTSSLNSSKQRKKKLIISSDSIDGLGELSRSHSQDYLTKRSIHDTKSGSLSEPPLPYIRYTTNNTKDDPSLDNFASNYERGILRDFLSPTKNENMPKNYNPVNRVVDIDEETFTMYSNGIP